MLSVSVTVTDSPGATLVALGIRAGCARLSATVLDTPPPGAGVDASIVNAVAAVARSLAGMTTRSSVLVTKFVERGIPLTRTSVSDTNPVPVTVSVTSPEFATTRDGDIALIAGTGDCTVMTSLCVIAV